MRAGFGPTFQNYTDWERFEALESGEAVGEMTTSDAEVWRDNLGLIDLAEPLGYDSVWTLEHRNTPYIMLPQPFQQLAWVVGRTKRIDVGTMVVILPWNEPFRLAEQISVLSHMLGRDRTLHMGMGRGLGRREFSALGISMDESRERFAEAVEVMRLALRNERFTYEGKHYQYRDVTLRPRPLDNSIIDNAYCAWGSAPSVSVASGLGLRALTVPTRRLYDVQQEMAEYARGLERAGFGPPKPPIVQAMMYCSNDEHEAEETVLKALTEYADSAVRHYELGGEHLNHTKGYEHYNTNDGWKDPRKDFVDMYFAEGVWGTPKQCLEKIDAINDMLGAEHLAFWGNPGTMPASVAAKSLKLFAEECLPAVHKMKPREIDYKASASA